jgi:phosphatidylserine/phosphatidylglycerophosphate/cardiolipin synthase-like enzyme
MRALRNLTGAASLYGLAMVFVISTSLIGPQGHGTTAAAPIEATTGLAPAAAAAKGDAKPKFRVTPGVTFNNPLGSHAARRALIRKVNVAIDRAPKGSEIRIFSWKIYTRAGVTALLEAQKRGVKVRAIMDKKNTIVERNPHFPRLRKGLAAGNKNRAKKNWSGARLCDHSCRGRGGAAHSKFMLFSRAGASKYVYMASSANWGDAAANRQWNDMFTFVGNQKIYEAAVKVFDQAFRDKPLANPWFEQTANRGRIVVAWAPTDAQSRRSDRLLATLRQTKCKGATGSAGNANGRTIIRVAPDVIRGERGMNVARELRRLWDLGCDVKVGYTVMGKDVSQLLRRSGKRGPVPLKHLVQDFDGDGIFDRYFHLKTYTINGRIGQDSEAYWLLTGSSNTSKLALLSDEQLIYLIDQERATKRYQQHIEYWYNNYPVSAPTSSRVRAGIRAGTIDPYANMERD